MANTKVTSRVLADNAVLTANITDANVTTAKVADNAVTGDKVADDVALAGNPTTTTQSAGNNTTRIATTAFVTTAVANIVDSAPSALDTLNELAAAMGDDANFSTTITNSIAAKLPLAGGTMTGNLTLNGADIVKSGSADLTIDVGGRIDLSADDNGEIRLFDGSSMYAQFKDDSDRLKIQSLISDADMMFVGNDNGSEVTALLLDMSDAGKATFNAGAEFGGDVNIFGANRLINIGESGSGGTFGFLGWNDASNYLYLGNSYNSAYNTNIVINSSGNVGIGETSPDRHLHLTGSGANTGRIKLENTSASYYAGLVMTASAKEFHVGVGGASTAAGYANNLYIHDATAGALRATIDTNGKVGIGTASVGDLLHITNGDNAVDTRIRLQAFGQLPIWHTYYAAGTESSPTAPTSGTELGRFAVSTYDGSDYSQSAGQIRVVAEANHASNSAPSYMAFDTNNTTRLATERMRISSTGNTSIGTGTSTATEATSYAHADADDLVIRSNDGNMGITLATDTDDACNIWFSDATSGAGQYAGWILYNHSDNRLSFGTNSNERMRITADGYVGINKTSPVHTLDIRHGRANYASTVIYVDTGSGSTNYGLYINLANDPNDGTRYLFQGQSGAVTKAQIMSNGSYQSATNSYGSTSDEKLKENINDASNKLSEVMQLKVRNFNYKADSDKQKLIGMIAQEVETVFPALVFESEDTETVDGEIKNLGTKTKSLKYSVFVPILIKAMQEQQTIIDDLKARIETLEG